MELNEIQDLIKFVAKSNVSEIELESKGFKLIIKNKNAETQYVTAAPTQQVYQHTIAAPAPQAAPVAAAPAAPVEAAAPKANSKYITVKSPMIGTYYTKPSPDKPDFVKVGDDVKAGSVLCVIEAMKLFNEIESEISGKIVEILVKDSSPVEYDQPLFVIDPS